MDWPWPHWQRLMARWLRRGRSAMLGLAAGGCGVWWLQLEVGDALAQAEQEVVRLQQQWAALPGNSAHHSSTPQSPPKPSPKPSSNFPQIQQAPSPQALSLLASVPGESRRAHLASDWQQAIKAHGLRLQSFQPLPTQGADRPAGGMPSQAVGLRLQGQFGDWVRLWNACAVAGPVCSLDKITLVAMGPEAEVQIDAVLRVWLKADAADAADKADDANKADARLAVERPAWIPLASPVPPRSASTVAAELFSMVPVGLGQSRAQAARSAAAPERLAAGPAPTASDGAGLGLGLGTQQVATWPQAPEQTPGQWPVEQVRLLGLWQHAGERQAIVSAGPYWARVGLGQRITLQGHRIEAITERGVRLRWAQGPALDLLWGDSVAEGKPK